MNADKNIEQCYRKMLEIKSSVYWKSLLGSVTVSLVTGFLGILFILSKKPFAAAGVLFFELVVLVGILVLYLLPRIKQEETQYNEQVKDMQGAGK